MADTSTAPGYAQPSEKDLLAAGDIDILDESGKAVPFKSLYEDSSSRQLIIFIRHYFCGHCEHYTQALSEELPQSKLDALTPPVKLSLIGLGEVSAVADYKKRTGCGFPLYSNPDQELYRRLGLVEHLGLGPKKPDYIKSSVVGGIISSFLTALGSGSQMTKGGNYKQNGGELLFEHGQLKWIHRMQNTRDHAEIAELKQVLGI